MEYIDLRETTILNSRNGTLYIAAQTLSRDFPGTTGGYQTELHGVQGAGVIVRMTRDLSATPIPQPLPPAFVTSVSTLSLTGLGLVLLLGGVPMIKMRRLH